MMQSETITAALVDAPRGLTPENYTINGQVAWEASIFLRQGQINYTLDGTDPTSTGNVMVENTVLQLTNARDIAGFKMKAVNDGSGNSAILYADYALAQPLQKYSA